MKKAVFVPNILRVCFCQIPFAQKDRDYCLDKDSTSFFKKAELAVKGVLANIEASCNINFPVSSLQMALKLRVL